MHPSRQPLIRISKTGEMRLRNKVGHAILKDNAHEERALDSRLLFIEKHQARQDKYLTYKQIDFACKKIGAFEEIPKTISTVMARHDCVLPQIQSMNLNNSLSRERTSIFWRKRSNSALDKSQTSGDFRPPRTGKESLEKAMALIRLSLQNRQTQASSSKQNQIFFTQQVQLDQKQNKGKNQTRKKNKEVSTSKTLPPLPHSRDHQRSRHHRGRLLSRNPSFPEMIELSREKSGLQDPRFLELESRLGEGRLFSWERILTEWQPKQT